MSIERRQANSGGHPLPLAGPASGASSRRVASNQTGVHERLTSVLQRHRAASFRKPIARHTALAFDRVAARVVASGRPLILDAGCGTGESTHILANRHPLHLVIGVDKSSHRLAKGELRTPTGPENVLLVRADLVDFWRLASQAGWRFDQLYLLYPNPWPKKQHLKRRFHGHPVFFDLLRLAQNYELRSNWRLYLEEFVSAFAWATGAIGRIETLAPEPPYLTPFEKKYAESGQPLYVVRIVHPTVAS